MVNGASTLKWHPVNKFLKIAFFFSLSPAQKNTQDGVAVVAEMEQVLEFLCLFLKGTIPLRKDKDLYCR